MLNRFGLTSTNTEETTIYLQNTLINMLGPLVGYYFGLALFAVSNSENTNEERQQIFQSIGIAAFSLILREFNINTTNNQQHEITNLEDVVPSIQSGLSFLMIENAGYQDGLLVAMIVNAYANFRQDYHHDIEENTINSLYNTITGAGIDIRGLLRDYYPIIFSVDQQNTINSLLGLTGSSEEGLLSIEEGRNNQDQLSTEPSTTIRAPSTRSEYLSL